MNSVCWCGHTWQSHSEEANPIQVPISPLTVDDESGFAVFVPAENLIAAYKEAVELSPDMDNININMSNGILNPMSCTVNCSYSLYHVARGYLRPHLLPMHSVLA